jgi:surfeit locus 1 family protein
MSRRLLALAAICLFALFCYLGTWQVQRHFWKQDLIARVDARVHGAPQPAPAPAEWPALQPQAFEYLPVRVQGRFDHARQLLVQASTKLGAGHWVLTPLQTDAGWWLWVNRGFVPPVRERGAPLLQPDGPVTVQGLMRVTEPKGGFLRSNDAAAGRWFSRDVAAMSAAQALPDGQVAPYFVDAAATPGAKPGEWPVGGLTVIQFANSHLAYIFTWYALALMVAGAAFYVWRHDRAGRTDTDDERTAPDAPHGP